MILKAASITAVTPYVFLYPLLENLTFLAARFLSGKLILTDKCIAIVK